MRIVVTGASGFVGRSLCDAVLARGHEPIAVDLRARKSDAFDRADAVVHLAAIAHRGRVGDEELQRVNVVLAEQVGRDAAAAGAHMIFMSSVKVHGEAPRELLTESSPILPADAYARSKARAEEALRAIPGLQLTVLRPPLVYGPAVKANFLSLLSAVAHGVPLPFARVANRRSLVYIGNLVDLVVRCIAKQAPGRTYLISDGAGVSTPELCRKLGHALGRPARLFAFPPELLELLPALRKLTRSLEVDDSAIRRELGWQPPYSVEEGLRATAQWYRSR